MSSHSLSVLLRGKSASAPRARCGWRFRSLAAGTSYPASFLMGLDVFIVLPVCASGSCDLRSLPFGKLALEKLENRRSVLRVGLHRLLY